MRLLFNCGVNIQIFCDNKDAVYVAYESVNHVFVKKKLSYCQETMQCALSTLTCSPAGT